MKYLWICSNVLRIKLELWLGMGYRVVSNSRQSFVERVEGLCFITENLCFFCWLLDEHFLVWRSPYVGGPGNETHKIHVKLLSGSIHWLAGRMIKYDSHNLAQRFALLSHSPWGADVVNLLTTLWLKTKALDMVTFFKHLKDKSVLENTL